MHPSRTVFAVLGPLQVRVDSRRVPVIGGRQERLLATLLIHANKVVSRDQLIEAVWAGSTPNTARRQIPNSIAALRRQLRATAAGQRIVTEGPGYLLRADADELDSEVFERQVAEGQQLARNGELAKAAAVLRDGLGLWRGPAFAGLGGPTIERAAEHLHQRQLVALEKRFDLELALGAEQELITELTTAVAAHPTHERLVAQLMSALYRCGRQAESLAAYGTLRDYLRTELGVDPSPPLQELHVAILRNDPTRLPPTAKGRLAVAGPAWVPAQLPLDVAGFSGRTVELHTLDAFAERADSSRVVVISGAAGVGKTALAVHWAHRAADRFPDGQLYVDLRGFGPEPPLSATDAVRGFLEAMAVAPQRIPVDLNAQVGLYRSLLASRQLLVVLDNARDAEQVRPLLPGATGCRSLVTSRNQLSGLLTAQAAHPVILEVLPHAEARDVLGRRLGEARLAAEPAATEQILASCAGLPLALSLAAARAATRPAFPLAWLATQLSEARSSLEALAGTDQTADLRVIFSWSYRTLSSQAAHLFRLLGLHPGPDFSTAAAASLAGIPPCGVASLLAELTGGHLVTEHVPGRFRLHDLVHAYAADLVQACDSNDARSGAWRRVVSHYLHTALRAARLLSPHREPITPAGSVAGVSPEGLTDDGEALRWFGVERPVLLAVAARAARHGLDEPAWQLAWAIFDFLDRRGDLHDMVSTQRAALHALERLGDQRGQARASRLLALALARLSEFDDSLRLMRRALETYRSLSDRLGQANTHLGISFITSQRGDDRREALTHAERALALYQVEGDEVWQARALNDIGWSYTLLGDHQQAIVHCRQALGLFQKLADGYGEANTYDTLGHAHHHTGDHQQALACYQRSLTLFQAVGEQRCRAEVLERMGDLQLSAGERGAAGRAWQQALDILRELGAPATDQLCTKLSRLG